MYWSYAQVFTGVYDSAGQASCRSAHVHQQQKTLFFIDILIHNAWWYKLHSESWNHPVGILENVTLLEHKTNDWRIEIPVHGYV